ncbi:transposase [Actinomadura sp. B10D3]|uniref:transposase n=1 Tax=Actinomadura sp. B10D3 TaxID=3153557 RepID=UPI00325F6284
MPPSDAEWAFIEPYLPVGSFGPYPERLREQSEGVIWWFRTEAQWRETPGEFGAWFTVSNRFRQRRTRGCSRPCFQGDLVQAGQQVHVQLVLGGEH